jgi:hypothetical protein
MKFSKEDVEKFTIEVCTKCHCKEHCESKKLRKEACGKMFNWKIGYRSFVADVLEKQRKEQGICLK